MKPGARLALYDSIPVLFSYFPLGIIFGILLEHLKFTWWYAPVQSTAAYAAAVQLLGLNLLDENKPLWIAAAAIFPVALRNTFYVTTTLRDLNKFSLPKRLFLAFGMADAPFGILLNRGFSQVRQSYCITLFALSMFYWISGSFVGAWVGSQIYELPDSIEFILTALFTVLAYEQAVKIKNWGLLLAYLCIGALGIIFFPDKVILFGLIIGAPVIYFMTRNFNKKA